MSKTSHEKLVNSEALRRLFRAFRDGNGTAFRKVADAIISEQLAANHHGLAKELRKAIGPETKGRDSTSSSSLTSIPRDRRSGEQLLTIYREPASTGHLLLDSAARHRIDRVVDEHRNMNKLARYGYAPKSKLLFWGPPGCGKTLTAHHLANQLNLKVGVVRLSALVSSYMGDTASHLQKVFDVAQKTPMVILFDEVDTVAKTRDDPRDVGELKRVVNSLLQAMDTFSSKKSILIGASNHQHLLDDAIWRRFDDVVLFSKPSPASRRQFIQYHMNGIKLKGAMETLGKKTAGLSYAQIELILVESIKSMILQDKKQLTLNDIVTELKYMRSMMSAANRKNTPSDE